MAKRDTSTTRSKTFTAAADSIEQRVLAFAEQLGRMAGTIQAKTGGWTDRETLNAQIAGVRDGASHLLEQLTGGSKKAAKKKGGKAPVRRAGSAVTSGRSGGTVDAPGKKHRKPTATDGSAKVAASQAAKVRTAKTMVKTSKRRGRG